LRLKIIFPLFAAVCASAQPVCPPINFLNATTINMDATDSSHLVALRQSDGSYTAFELANTSPYRVLHTIPHFEKVFSNCLPRQSPAGLAKAAAPVAATTVAQPADFAVLDSGNYLFVSTEQGNSVEVAVFDQHLNLISLNEIGDLSTDEPPGYANAYLSLILADVNGDGKLDLIADSAVLPDGASGFGGAVQVFLGDGTGGFKPAGGFPLSGFVSGAMAVADLNGDGKPDLLVGSPPGSLQVCGAGEGAGNIVVALGKGDGNFVASTIPTPGSVGPVAIAIADLNGDGKNDLVFLTCTLTASVPNQIVVMLGKGDGTFSPPAGFAVAGSSSEFNSSAVVAAIAVGDVNGDGIPDIVTNGITILLGDGKGGFPTRKDFLNTAGESVILTDFDGDGKIDVVIGGGNPLALSAGPLLTQQQNTFAEDTLTVFLGDGAGGLDAAPLLPAPIPPTQRYSPETFPNLNQDVAIAAGDFNKDGNADLALLSSFQYLSVFLGRANSTLTPVFTYDFAAVDPQAFPTSVVTGDFNQDGILDLAVTVARPSSDGSIMVFLGVGDGTFLPPVSSDAPGSIWSLVTGDFNRDGHADLAAIGGAPSADQVVVFLGKGDGTFASPQIYPSGASTVALAVGDFNQDGFDDIANVGFTGGVGINFLLGAADGKLTAGKNIPFPTSTPLGQYIALSLATADLNGDGRLDLVAGVQPEGVAVVLGHGDGTFGPLTTYPTGPNNASGLMAVVVGDINGDGIPDVFVSDGNILIGNGDGTFQLQATDALPLYGPLIAADFNGDGKLDVASGFFTSPAGILSQPGATVFFNLSNSGGVFNVVSAADFSLGPVAPHSIASAFGEHLALTTASATPPALPTTLGGASVSVQDQTGAVSQAEIYFASPEQVNFVLPAGLDAGTALVTIATTDGKSASSEIQIAPLAPKIFQVDPSGIPAGYALRVGPDNVQTIEPIFTEQGGSIQEVPIDLSTGDVYLVLYGTGFDTPVGVGAQIFPTPLTVTYAGPQRQFPGLDQINMLLPKSLAGMGASTISLYFDGLRTLLVNITIK
jgi:uncharacterized protein (TIGR03437 family)